MYIYTYNNVPSIQCGDGAFLLSETVVREPELSSRIRLCGCRISSVLTLLPASNLLAMATKRSISSDSSILLFKSAVICFIKTPTFSMKSLLGWETGVCFKSWNIIY